jgi:hypothetical protein
MSTNSNVFYRKNRKYFENVTSAWIHGRRNEHFRGYLIQFTCGFCGKGIHYSWAPVRSAAGVLLGTLLLSLAAQGGDEVKYKSKSYQASKTLKTNTYQPKTFEAKEEAPKSRQLTEKPAPEAKKLTAEPATSSATLESVTPFEGNAPSEEKLLDAKSYVPGDTDHPSTITAKPGGMDQDKKIYQPSTNKSAHIIIERPDVRNPLLEPHQGIKAPDGDTESKDAKK